jgi:hypothetical protein
MSDLSQTVDALNAGLDTVKATLNATSAKLDKVLDEFVTTIADITDKLNAALAADRVTPELVASVEAAKTKLAGLTGDANQVKTKVDALDELNPDKPAA